MEIQSSYFSYLFVLGIGQSVLLTTALWKSKKPKALSRRFFLAVLVIMTVELIYGLLYQSQAFFDFPHLLRINTVLVLGYGPALYLALVSFFKPDQGGKNWHWHFLPSLLTLLYFTPLFMASTGFKLNYLNIMYEGVHPDSLIFGGIRRLQQGVYAVFIFLLIRRQPWRTQLKDHYLKMLLIIIGLFAFMWLGDIYRYFFQFDLYSGIVNSVVMSGVLLFLTWKIILKGGFFDSGQTNKYASSALTHQQEQALIERLELLFKQEKSFTDSSLTLSRLGEKLEVPANYLSQAINHQLQTGYSDFVNGFRVEEAKRLLEDPENHKLTLAYIGEEAGFKSSSSFNAAFKKITGQTPSSYRQLFS